MQRFPANPGPDQRQRAVRIHLYQPRSASLCDTLSWMRPRATEKVSASRLNWRRLNTSASNPDRNIDFSQFEPISATPGYKTSNTIPYTESYMVSIQRQIGRATLVNVSYVGNQAHHLLVLEAANPGNPALCLSLSQPSEVAPGSATCGPFGESTTYTSASGQTINGTGGHWGRPLAASATRRLSAIPTTTPCRRAFTTAVSGRRLFFSYTWSKSIDQASNFGDQVDPFDANLGRGLSSFDMRQNFVASYTWSIPLERLSRAHNRWTEGWSVSGILRFSTGLQ